ncbi:MAG: XdhC family protein, partial [Gaiellales bacterium]
MTERASDDPLVLAGRLRQAREPFALATVVGVVRPASARVGNRALISQDGTVHGWIGGACSEPAVVLEALRAIQDGRHRLVRVSRGGEGQADDGAIMAESSCASDGVVDVFVEPQLPTPLLVVVGTSPTAETLVTLASGIGWETAREAHASADAVVVATMGHGDADVLAEVLVSQADYVGLVASARRARAVTAELRSRGLPDE